MTLDGNTGSVYDLEKRNAQANATIGKWADRHRLADVGIGLSGLLPVPGAATAALIAAIGIQGPLIYTPMSKELASIYRADVDEHTKNLILNTVVEGAKYDISIELGIEFMKEIASDIIGELVAGVALTAIPVLGAFAAAYLDAMVAATLTWRVGTMMSAYFQNGEAWVGDRKATYHLAAAQVGKYSTKTTNRADLNDLSKNNPVIRETQVSEVLRYVKMLQRAACSKESILSSLRGENFPFWIVEQVLKRAYA